MMKPAQATDIAAPEINTGAAPRSLAVWVAGLFSFPVMCVFLLAAAILWLSAQAIAEPDIWWHLRNAAYLFQHHSLPSLDTYSIGAAGSPWLDHEWLSEIPLFLGYKVMGLQGMLAVFFAVLVLIYSGVYYRAFRAGADCLSASVATLLAMFLGIVCIGPRPLLFGWLCMMALLLVLDHFARKRNGLWLLPPLFALWINFHGSWVFGMVVFVITIASGLIEGEWGLVVARRWTPSELKKLLFALAASTAALFVNPFGYRLVLYPFDLLFRQTSNMTYVQEWHSTDFSKGSGKLAMIVIFAWLAAALLSRRRWKLDEVLLTGFALWAGLSHVRLLFFTGLIIAPMLAPYLHLGTPYHREIDKPLLNAPIMAVAVAWLVFSFPSAARLQQQANQQYPVAALEYMQQHHLNGRIFNSDAWGGYMEWTTPELKPFTDSRADIFVHNGTFDDYVKAVLIQTPLEVLDKYRMEYVLLELKQPMSCVLKQSATWHAIYSDNIAVLFKRSAAESKAVN